MYVTKHDNLTKHCLPGRFSRVLWHQISNDVILYYVIWLGGISIIHDTSLTRLELGKYAGSASIVASLVLGTVFDIVGLLWFCAEWFCLWVTGRDHKTEQKSYLSKQLRHNFSHNCSSIYRHTIVIFDVMMMNYVVNRQV